MSQGQLPAFIQLKKEGVVLSVSASPGAKKSEIVGPTPGGFLKIKLAAPAIEGKANKELIRFLAEFFRVRKSDIEILSGETARKKRILIQSVQLEKIKDKLKVS